MAHAKVAPSDGGEIEITPEMIEAGVTQLRDMTLGLQLNEMAKEIYLAMEIERKFRPSLQPSQ